MNSPVKTNKEIYDKMMAIKNHDSTKEFYEYLKDKNVEIVGPAETTIGKNRGKEIDSKDVIIRFNTVISYMPFSESLSNDIGTRTDVLYMVPAILRNFINTRKDWAESMLRNNGVKYIVIKPNNHSTCSTNNNIFVTDHNDIINYYSIIPPEDKKAYDEFRQFCKDRSLDIKLCIHNYSVAELSTLISEINGSAFCTRTGFLPIFDTLCSDAKSLHISGMTFYHKGGHLFREISVNTDKELHPLLNNNNKNADSHDSVSELVLMKQLYNIFDHKLTCDSDLTDLLIVDNPYLSIYSEQANNIAIDKNWIWNNKNKNK